MTTPGTSTLTTFQRRALAVAIIGAYAVIGAQVFRALSGHTVHWDPTLPALLILSIAFGVIARARRRTGRRTSRR